jgi:hypothetical protein
MSLVHFVVKTHKKDQYPQMQVFKFIAYFFERAYKFNMDDPIVLVFDMSDAGYANLVTKQKLIYIQNNNKNKKI